MKIASLIPSGTDIACSLGLQEQLVGISHACDHPETRGLPILTRSIIDSTQSPQQIDTAVNEAVAAGQSLYLTNKPLLRELEPDVVLTQTICDVCAVNANQAARDLPPGAKLINLSATSIDGLWEDLTAVAEATAVDSDALIANLKARVEAVRNATSPLQARRVLVVEWTEPPFLGGHWVPEMVHLAGGIHLLSGPGEASRRATWAEIEAVGPEVLIFAPCGYDLEQTRQQAEVVMQSEPFFHGFQGEIWITNATALFSRCTPATVKGIEVLAGLLHHEVFGAPDITQTQRLR